MKTLLDIPLYSICAKQRNAHKVTNLYKHTTQDTEENILKKTTSFSILLGVLAFFPSQFITKRSEWKTTKRKQTWGQELLQKALRDAASWPVPHDFHSLL